MAMGQVAVLEPSCSNEPSTPILVPRGTMTFLMDASWDKSRNAGMSFLVYATGGKLVHVVGRKFTAHDVLQAETWAFLQALEFVESTEQGRYVIYSDCKTLVEAILGNKIEEMSSWEVQQVAVLCRSDYEALGQRVTLRYWHKNFLKDPHDIADKARWQGLNF